VYSVEGGASANVLFGDGGNTSVLKCIIWRRWSSLSDTTVVLELFIFAKYYTNTDTAAQWLRYTWVYPGLCPGENLQVPR